MHITNHSSDLTPGDGMLNCTADRSRFGVLVSKKVKGFKRDRDNFFGGIQQRNIALHDAYTPAYQCV